MTWLHAFSLMLIIHGGIVLYGAFFTSVQDWQEIWDWMKRRIA